MPRDIAGGCGKRPGPAESAAGAEDDFGFAGAGLAGFTGGVIGLAGAAGLALPAPERARDPAPVARPRCVAAGVERALSAEGWRGMVRAEDFGLVFAVFALLAFAAVLFFAAAPFLAVVVFAGFFAVDFVAADFFAAGALPVFGLPDFAFAFAAPDFAGFFAVTLLFAPLPAGFAGLRAGVFFAAGFFAAAAFFFGAFAFAFGAAFFVGIFLLAAFEGFLLKARFLIKNGSEITRVWSGRCREPHI